MKQSRILVVSNYSPDKQHSMLKFAKLLFRIYSPLAIVDTASPPVFASKLPFASQTLKKYLAYIDKLIIFPIWLILNSRSYQKIHIADHGNAFYCFFCPQDRTLVTCHDLLAVRGAMGDRSVACNSSLLGPVLQQFIILGLKRASTIIFVSEATYRDYLALCPLIDRQHFQVIPNPLNAPFESNMSIEKINSTESSLVPCSPYLLMVGSSLPRKNRSLCLKVLTQLADNSSYSIVFAGAPLTTDEIAFKTTSSFGERLISIANPSHEVLNLLYCKAHALLFPSFSEGFGWPLIEAQTCGCPIIASNTTCIPEVASSGALYSDPSDVLQFIKYIRLLENPDERLKLINLGFENLKRFNYDRIASAYRNLACL